MQTEKWNKSLKDNKQFDIDIFNILQLSYLKET